MNDNRDDPRTLGKMPDVNYTDGDDPRRPAKFGRPRDGNDADASVAAQELNNADPVYELIDGRCSYDGLPEGNCAHFPGEQAVVAPDGTAYVEGSVKLDENGIPVHARPEHGARQPAGPDYPARTDKEANATTAKARGEGSGTEPRKS